MGKQDGCVFMSKKRESTRNAIINAFIVLLYEKGKVSAISVKDIIAKAFISRSTFYTYFDNIDDVTAAMAQHYGEELGDILRDHTPVSENITGYHALYYRLLDFVKQHQTIASAILLNYSNAAVTKAIQGPMCEAFLELYRPAHMSASELQLQYTAQYWTYGVYGFLKEWVQENCEPDTEEMSLILMNAVITSQDFLQDVPETEQVFL